MKGIIACLLLAFAMFVHAANNLSVNVDVKQSSFVIPLKANPTTGYNWSVIQFDKNLLGFTHSEYQRPNTQLMGAGGTMLFTFTLNKKKSYPKSTTITFKYARAWEPEKAVMQIVVVNFVQSN